MQFPRKRALQNGWCGIYTSRGVSSAPSKNGGFTMRNRIRLFGGKKTEIFHLDNQVGAIAFIPVLNVIYYLLTLVTARQRRFALFLETVLLLAIGSLLIRLSIRVAPWRGVCTCSDVHRHRHPAAAAGRLPRLPEEAGICHSVFRSICAGHAGDRICRPECAEQNAAGLPRRPWRL